MNYCLFTALLSHQIYYYSFSLNLGPNDNTKLKRHCTAASVMITEKVTSASKFIDHIKWDERTMHQRNFSGQLYMSFPSQKFMLIMNKHVNSTNVYNGLYSMSHCMNTRQTSILTGCIYCKDIFQTHLRTPATDLLSFLLYIFTGNRPVLNILLVLTTVSYFWEGFRIPPQEAAWCHFSYSRSFSC